MNDRTSCATPEALVTYLYAECEPVERESIAAHVAICASCAEEVRALGDTRAHLASWSPPALPLGFQITRTESDQPAKVLRPAAWYRQPLPAWAQMAAAVAIFAAGMSVSAFRSSGEQPRRIVEEPETRPVAMRADAQPDDLRVTRAEFGRLEARLRAMEGADVSRASYEPRTGDADDLRAQFIAIEGRVSANESRNSRSVKDIFAAVNKLQGDIEANRAAAERLNAIDDELQQIRRVLLSPGLIQRAALTSGR
jgi:hypothetical protein